MVHHVKFDSCQVIFPDDGAMNSDFIISGMTSDGMQYVHFLRFRTS